MLLFSRQVLSDSAIPRTVAHPTPLSTGFSRLEYWSGQSLPSPEDLPDAGTEPTSPALADGFFTTEPPGKHSMCFAQALRVPQPLCPRVTFAIKQPPWLEGERPPSGVGLQFTEEASGTWNPVGDHSPVPLRCHSPRRPLPRGRAACGPEDSPSTPAPSLADV